LANALRRARGRQPQYLIGPNKRRYYGYSLAEENLPVSIENVHTDYAETDTIINFRLSNGNSLQLYFPQSGGLSLLLDPAGKDVRAAASFRTAYPINIAVVPVLGPVEHEEDYVQPETVQRGLETHRASRHFRSYWKYNLDRFAEFADLVAKTWPGMQIEEPELPPRSSKLRMFCLENRITRELYWSGFGFQVWCQLLTHISRAKGDTLLIIDEPEIYLHPDIQRQLLAIVRDIGPDILLATHSTEIMSEADPAEILLIDKSTRSAERLRDVAGVQIALQKVGSIQNITLTRLARNRTMLFVESADDFVLLRRFARKLGLLELATGVDLTAAESEGFSRWKTISDFAWGVKKALTTSLKIGAIFDRDYFPDEELQEIHEELSKSL
jgi:AAA domain, putative AbiEii toxin, Type IV TA system